MNEQTIALEGSWKSALSTEFEQPYMQRLKSFLIERKQMGKRIFPRGSEYFRALDLTPLTDVKVVILGQDPYHGEGQAHGLCFSVQPGIRIPPSLVNIYKELQADLGIVPPRHGFLEHWARQGVLLLNSVLTVEEAQAASHQGKGWETFTDAVIRKSTTTATRSSSSSGAPMRSARRRSSIHPGTSFSNRRIRRRFRRITAFSAAITSRRPTPFLRNTAVRRSTGSFLNIQRMNSLR